MNDQHAKARGSGRAATAQPGANGTGSATPKDALTIGWREWVIVPRLGLTAIKAKIDTGARTSSLHAYDIVEETAPDGQVYINFTTQPIQRNDAVEVQCRAPLVDKRRVTDSGGHAADRPVIHTLLQLGNRSIDVEVTLADRTGMLFRMLIGRTSLVSDVIVDPARSFVLGRVNMREHYSTISTETENRT